MSGTVAPVEAHAASRANAAPGMLLLQGTRAYGAVQGVGGFEALLQSASVAAQALLQADGQGRPTPVAALAAGTDGTAQLGSADPSAGLSADAPGDGPTDLSAALHAAMTGSVHADGQVPTGTADGGPAAEVLAPGITDGIRRDGSTLPARAGAAGSRTVGTGGPKAPADPVGPQPSPAPTAQTTTAGAKAVRGVSAEPTTASEATVRSVEQAARDAPGSSAVSALVSRAPGMPMAAGSLPTVSRVVPNGSARADQVMGVRFDAPQHVTLAAMPGNPAAPLPAGIDGTLPAGSSPAHDGAATDTGIVPRAVPASVRGVGPIALTPGAAMPSDPAAAAGADDVLVTRSRRQASKIESRGLAATQTSAPRTDAIASAVLQAMRSVPAANVSVDTPDVALGNGGAGEAARGSIGLSASAPANGQASALVSGMPSGIASGMASGTLGGVASDLPEGPGNGSSGGQSNSLGNGQVHGPSTGMSTGMSTGQSLGHGTGAGTGAIGTAVPGAASAPTGNAAASGATPVVPAPVNAGGMVQPATPSGQVRSLSRAHAVELALRVSHPGTAARTIEQRYALSGGQASSSGARQGAQDRAPMPAAGSASVLRTDPLQYGPSAVRMDAMPALASADSLARRAAIDTDAARAVAGLRDPGGASVALPGSAASDGMPPAPSGSAAAPAPSGPSAAAALTNSVSAGSLGGMFAAESAAAARTLALHDAAAPQAIADTIRLTLAQGRQSARIDLTPAELGAMSVDLEQKDGRLAVSLHSPLGATRDLIESLLPRLREQLANDTNSSVSVDVGERGEEGERRAARHGLPANTDGGRDAGGTRGDAERSGADRAPADRSDLDKRRGDDADQSDSGGGTTDASVTNSARSPDALRPGTSRVLDAWI